MSLPATDLYQKLEEYFRPEQCTEVFPVIGLQHHNTDEIAAVYTATFTGDEVFAHLKKIGATDCMLFTHHPVPQRQDPRDPPPPIPEEHLELMRQQRISLFSYHIPLDRNGKYSPGNRLAEAIGATPYGEFYEQNQVRMGVLCNTLWNTAAEAAEAMQEAVGHAGKLYPYGGDILPGGRIAIMAGGARNTAIYQELREAGVGLFLTGVTNPEIPWIADIHAEAKRNGVSILGGTHYSTEKFAPMAMTEFFRELGLHSEFIPETPHHHEL